MRALPVFAVIATTFVLVATASAQTSRKSLYIETTPRSWLDPGRAYEPGASQNYVYDSMSGGIPNVGRSGNFGLLPDRFSGGSPIKIDIPAPEALRR